MRTLMDMVFLSELVMVDVSLWNKAANKYSQMLITVDTGASVTTISTDLHLVQRRPGRPQERKPLRRDDRPRPFSQIPLLWRGAA